MTQQMLVTYASKSGTTAEVAAAIADTLRTQGVAVDLKPVKDVRDLNGYSSVVIGSGIRVGQWIGPARQFVERHQDALRSVPTAFFTVCMTLKDDTPETRAEVHEYTASQRELVPPMAEAFFAGRVQRDTLGFIEKMAMSAMKLEDADYRDWDAIRAWAAGLPAQLNGE
jgi:menaquinone-dependent protoporphyrinogen oxidase